MVEEKSEKEIAEEHKKALDFVEMLWGPEEKEEKRKAKYPPKQQKKRGGFTHFVTVPLNFPPVFKLFEELKEEISVMNINNLESGMFLPHGLFHLSILRLFLYTEAEKEKAAKVFEESREEINNILEGKSLNLSLEGLGIMSPNDQIDVSHSRVVYCKVKENDDFVKLKEITNVLVTNMLKQNVLDKGRLQFIDNVKGKYYTNVYHLTLINVSYVKKFKITYDSTQIMEKYQNIDFGTHLIPELHISTRYHYREDGFYIPLSILPLPTN